MSSVEFATERGVGAVERKHATGTSIVQKHHPRGRKSAWEKRSSMGAKKQHMSKVAAWGQRSSMGTKKQHGSKGAATAMVRKGAQVGGNSCIREQQRNAVAGGSGRKRVAAGGSRQEAGGSRRKRVEGD